MVSGKKSANTLRAEAADWLVKVASAPDDGTIRQGLDEWRSRSDAHRAAWSSVSRAWNVAGNLQAKDRHRSATARPSRRAAARLFWAAGLGLAASLALWVSPTVYRYLSSDIVTDTGEHRNVSLPDGSVASLDSGSSVAFRFDEVSRQVTLLGGRAFFRVTPSEAVPFTVTARNVTVTVTGTSFDVNVLSSGIVVSVETGHVKVGVAHENQPVNLERGQRLTVNARGARELASVDPAQIAAWQDNRLVVDGVPFEEVVEELGRHYNGLILVRGSGLANRHVSGVFDLSDPVDALRALARTQKASITAVTPYVLVVSSPAY